jgi:hypothetical protein
MYTKEKNYPKDNIPDRFSSDLATREWSLEVRKTNIRLLSHAQKHS